MVGQSKNFDIKWLPKNENVPAFETGMWALSVILKKKNNYCTR